MLCVFTKAGYLKMMTYPKFNKKVINVFHNENPAVPKVDLIIYLNNKFNYINKMALTKYKTWEGQFIEVKKGEYLTKPISHNSLKTMKK